MHSSKTISKVTLNKVGVFQTTVPASSDVDNLTIVDSTRHVCSLELTNTNYMYCIINMAIVSYVHKVSCTF